MDIGAFIPLGSGTELFRMGRISPLRVYVEVPEPLTEFVRVGAEADLTVARVGGRKYAARVVGTAQAINPTAKRLLTELEVPNERGDLFPDAYVQVTLKIDGDKGALAIPAGALLSARENPPLASSVRMAKSRSEILRLTAISAPNWKSPRLVRIGSDHH